MLGTGPGGDGAAVGKREDGAGEGVFKGEDTGGAGVDVGAKDGVVLDVWEGKVVAVGGEDGDGEGAAQGGEAAGFPVFGSLAWWVARGLERGFVYQPMMCERESARTEWGG